MAAQPEQLRPQQIRTLRWLWPAWILLIALCLHWRQIGGAIGVSLALALNVGMVWARHGWVGVLNVLGLHRR